MKSGICQFLGVCGFGGWEKRWDEVGVANTPQDLIVILSYMNFDLIHTCKCYFNPLLPYLPVTTIGLEKLLAIAMKSSSSTRATKNRHFKVFLYNQVDDYWSLAFICD